VKRIAFLGALLVVFLLTATACTSDMRGADIPLEMDEDFCEELEESQENCVNSPPNTNLPDIDEEWDTLYRFEQDGLWGYKDAYGNVIIEPQFNRAFDFSEGLASVGGIPGDSDFRGFIDLTGNPVISLPSIVGISSGFQEGFAVIIERRWDRVNDDPRVVSTPGPFVFIDRTGQNVFGREFESTRPFQEGFARVIPAAPYRRNTIFIDKTGQTAFDLEFQEARDFRDGYAMVILLDGTHTHIDRYGNIVDKGGW